MCSFFSQKVEKGIYTHQHSHNPLGQARPDSSCRQEYISTNPVDFYFLQTLSSICGVFIEGCVWVDGEQASVGGPCVQIAEARERGRILRPKMILLGLHVDLLSRFLPGSLVTTVIPEGGDLNSSFLYLPYPLLICLA